MKALRLRGSSAPVLSLEEIPAPNPGDNQVLIRVCAAGVTPTELAWYPTTHTRDGAPRSGPVPGHEFSGIIAATGRSVSGLEAGTPVFGNNRVPRPNLLGREDADWLHPGRVPGPSARIFTRV